MKVDRWRQIDGLLGKALDLEPAEQESFLDEACAGDPDLRAELTSLLAERRTGLFDRPVVDAVAAELVEEKLQSMVGRQFCSYEILAPLGSGGMGVVYRALDARLGRTVALKVLPEDVVHDKDRMRRFTTEARAASSLNHPNICTVHELGDCQGIRFITMEYVEGQTLSEIAARRFLSVSEIVEVAIQVADALDEAHYRGVIHRDIKPANLMMTARSLVKVLDFGIAKVRKPAGPGAGTTRTTLTQEGMILGTVAYMSPEQVLGRDVDGRADIFSLGAVLYELATGRLPFPGDTPTEAMDRILHAEPGAFDRPDDHLPNELERIVRRCLEKDPNRRYQSAGQLLTDLKNFRQRIAPSPATRQVIPRRTAFAVIALIAVVAVITALWLKRDAWLPMPMRETPLTVVPLTSYAGYERDPSFSPDGSQVVFSWSPNPERPYDSDIYVKQVGSEVFFRLTADDAMDTDPAWSPDGRSIAFLRTAEECSLILKPPLGGAERTLVGIGVLPGDLYWDQNVAWHPEAKWLVAPVKTAEREPFALFAISPETGERKRLTSPPAGSVGDSGPAFSPNGATLAFSRWAAPGRSSVHLLSVSDHLVPTGEPRRITFNHRAFDPEWTPDGNEIIYVSGSVHATSLWRLNPKQPGNPRPLAVPGRTYAPAFSRQGQLAFAQLLLDVNVWKADASLEKERASSPVAVISSTYVDHTASFSHDGRRIAFVSYRSGAPEVWVCDRDGSNLASLTSFGGPYLDLPVWSPDGKQIAFGFSGETSGEIYVINAQGGKPRRLTAGHSPCYSPDGKWLYFESGQADQPSIYKIPVEGGEKIRVTRNHSGTPKLSPDGRHIYYLKAEGSLWRRPIDGGAEHEIQPAVHYNDYAIVKRGVYFIPGEANPDWSIDFLDFRTAKVSRLLRLPRLPQWGFDVSPDGKELLYSQNDGLDADLLMVENFR